MLELDDIQSGALRPRPTPYAATYLYLRIDDRNAGRALMGRASQVVASAAHHSSPVEDDTWVSIAISHQGLTALGLPEEALSSFPEEFRQGMAARAAIIGDTGENGPKHWDPPFGTDSLHAILIGLAPDRGNLDVIVARARQFLEGLAGVTLLGRQDCFAPADEKEAFGYKDGISHPAIEGSGIPGSNPHEVPLKPGELVLGYPDEMGIISQPPFPDSLGRNGTFVAVRKLHQRVADFRKFLKEHSTGLQEEELLAAKLMGRWRSGAPLALSPERDDPALGIDPKRNNDFLYFDDDKLGYKTPPGSHIRRMNPRDAIKESGTSVRIRRMIRRGTSYGPPLPLGVLEDDGKDRGLMFVFVGASLRKQFEFVQSVWLNDGEFIAAGNQRDPVARSSADSGEFVIPRRPVRRRLPGIPQFVTTRGGEYFFMPGIRALRWIAELR